MNTNTTSEKFDAAGIKSQLKQIGDQIESIAKQLRGQGNQQDIDELYELGDKVEHFCDNMDFSAVQNASDKSASFASASTSKSNGTSAADSSHANQTGQKNQDAESIDSQKPKPVM